MHFGVVRPTGYHDRPRQEISVTESARTRVAPSSPLRTQARAALERALTRAVASGALPEAADAADAPAVEIERRVLNEVQRVR